MKTNNFDLVMDYIEENINLDFEDIKKGIRNLIGYNSNMFGNCFSVLCGETLYHYIASRKLAHAAEDLVNTERDIVDIALDYYSEQSAFTRALKSFFNVTPNEVRQKKIDLCHRKYKLKDFCRDETNTQTQEIILLLENNIPLRIADIDKQIEIYEAFNDYVFDIDTVYAISDLAEKLEVPLFELMNACNDLYITIHSDPDYLPPEIERAIDCGISSDEELKEICEFYNCKYYDLDSAMVDYYHRQKK